MSLELLEQAVAARATDIHLEPTQDALRIRLRVDGSLVFFKILPDPEGKQLCSRIKVQAGMDIAQRMLPQDGSMRLTCRGQSWDIRVASQPTILGEKLVLRLLPVQPLSRSCLPGYGCQDLRGLCPSLQGQGLVLVTGPTGCGKTTTCMPR